MNLFNLNSLEQKLLVASNGLSDIKSTHAFAEEMESEIAPVAQKADENNKIISEDKLKEFDTKVRDLKTGTRKLYDDKMTQFKNMKKRRKN